MIRKRYEVKGMMEWHPEFKVGRTRLQVSFTGGHLCGGAATAASYETSDPVVQAVIEGSAYFRSGRIRLVMGSGAGTGIMCGQSPTQRQHDIGAGGADSCASGAAVRMTAPHEMTVMEFENVVQAGDFLQEKKGLPSERVVTLSQCEAEAKSLGIELKIKKSTFR